MKLIFSISYAYRFVFSYWKASYEDFNEDFIHKYETSYAALTFFMFFIGEILPLTTIFYFHLINNKQLINNQIKLSNEPNEEDITLCRHQNSLLEGANPHLYESMKSGLENTIIEGIRLETHDGDDDLIGK